MTVLVPNASEAERQRLPGGGARVALSWDPEHMHVVRESSGSVSDGETSGTRNNEEMRSHAEQT